LPQQRGNRRSCLLTQTLDVIIRELRSLSTIKVRDKTDLPQPGPVESHSKPDAVESCHLWKWSSSRNYRQVRSCEVKLAPETISHESTKSSSFCFNFSYAVFHKAYGDQGGTEGLDVEVVDGGVVNGGGSAIDAMPFWLLRMDRASVAKYFSWAGTS
jgi:hypothetical protein